MRTTLLLLLTIFLLLCCGCQRLILGDEEANDPVNNFELFWQDFDAHYGLFAARGWDWDSIYTEFRPQVTPATTDEELFGVFREMITYLDDSHTFVYWPGQAFFASNSETDEQTEAEFSLPQLLDRIEIADSSSAEGYYYGTLRDHDIGYLYLAGVEMEDEDFGDQLLRAVGHHAAIIIDLRNNSGGSDLVAARLAGRFADEIRLAYTVQERNGPAHDDLSGKREYFLRPLGETRFRKPVVVLTDNITVSAAEVFLNYIKLIPDVTQIGTATSGDFSDTGMRRFLPNGFQYQYSIMQFLGPDGRSLDGVGHVPEVEVRNTEAAVGVGEDLVLARALEFLWERYKIR